MHAAMTGLKGLTSLNENTVTTQLILKIVLHQIEDRSSIILQYTLCS